MHRPFMTFFSILSWIPISCFALNLTLTPLTKHVRFHSAEVTSQVIQLLSISQSFPWTGSTFLCQRNQALFAILDIKVGGSRSVWVELRSNVCGHFGSQGISGFPSNWGEFRQCLWASAWAMGTTPCHLINKCTASDE